MTSSQTNQSQGCSRCYVAKQLNNEMQHLGTIVLSQKWILNIHKLCYKTKTTKISKIEILKFNYQPCYAANISSIVPSPYHIYLMLYRDQLKVTKHFPSLLHLHISMSSVYDVIDVMTSSIFTSLTFEIRFNWLRDRGVCLSIW